MSASPPDQVVRIASYNTRDFLDDRAAAARVVRSIAPDVLCLQEVPRRLFGGLRVAAFARACGMDWIGGHRGSGGTTIFTGGRVRVVSSRHTRLPVVPPERTRGYAVARVRLPGGGLLDVASVHLSLRASQRDRHAARILAGLGSDGDGVPVVIAGDLNEGESGAAWQRFAAGLRMIGPTEPTYPAGDPVHLLDVVFASPGVAVVEDVGEGRAVALGREDLVAASDHRPVWVDIRSA